MITRILIDMIKMHFVHILLVRIFFFSKYNLHFRSLKINLGVTWEKKNIYLHRSIHCFVYFSWHCYSTNIRHRVECFQRFRGPRGSCRAKQAKEKYPKNVFKESVVLCLVVSTFGQQLSNSRHACKDKPNGIYFSAFAIGMYKPIALVACFPWAGRKFSWMCAIRMGGIRIGRKYFSMQMPGQVGAVNQKRTNREKSARLACW